VIASLPPVVAPSGWQEGNGLYTRLFHAKPRQRIQRDGKRPDKPAFARASCVTICFVSPHDDFSALLSGAPPIPAEASTAFGAQQRWTHRKRLSPAEYATFAFLHRLCLARHIRPALHCIALRKLAP
jgi:hypothetical protein